MRLASIVFIFDSQDRVLTGLKRKSYGAGFRSVPGGGIDPGESPEDAAVREVMEEAGIRISPQDLLSFFFDRQMEGDPLYVRRNQSSLPASLTKGHPSVSPVFTAATFSGSCHSPFTSRVTHTSTWPLPPGRSAWKYSLLPSAVTCISPMRYSSFSFSPAFFQSVHVPFLNRAVYMSMSR